jgi:hypothetical protein
LSVIATGTFGDSNIQSANYGEHICVVILTGE